MLNHLTKVNPNLKISSIDDPIFLKFGKILPSEHFQIIFDYLKNMTEMPIEGNQYVANDQGLQKLCETVFLCHDVFGDMPLQYGYVNGYNSKLNALEYHKSSEINIALTPLVLLLSENHLMKNNDLHASDITAFYIPAMTVIELFPLTLHFSPCKVSDDGFKCGVVLPFGTNQAFIQSKFNQSNEDKLLFKTNKWLITHAENTKLVDLNVHVGIIGSNIAINYK